jgi:hypothetical protein
MLASTLQLLDPILSRQMIEVNLTDSHGLIYDPLCPCKGVSTVHLVN